MEGAAHTVAATVGQLVSEEFRQLRGVGGQATELMDDLATMNALLRMQAEADDGAVDHFVREWMKQVRELAYDADDCLHLYMFRVRSRPSDGVVAWSRRLVATLFLRHRLAGDIDDLRARALAISQRHAQYGVSREALRRSPALAPVSAVATSAQSLRSATDHDQFVGVRAQAYSLAERMREVKPDDTKLKVFSIVGFGGLGKTTLAMEVCRQLEPEFEHQAQVSASQAFDAGKDLKGLLKRVLQQIAKPKASKEKGIQEEDSQSLHGIDAMDLQGLKKKLEDLLYGKRYLIVIDDIWTLPALDAIEAHLPENNSSSRIMLTTRIETVAKACSNNDDDYIYHIQPLNSEDSKKLFLSRAFGCMDNSYPKELNDAMINILKKCGGLPLAIVSIASLLAGYISPESKNMWETICRSMGSQIENNPTLEGMRQIVGLSYDYLPHHLKCCMMYLSLFPEDYIIDKVRLLNRWIAEGLVAEKRGMTSYEVAEAYFDELVSRNMIDLAKITEDERSKACRVHDIMLEVLVSKSLEANFVSITGRQYGGMSYGRIRRLSIHGNDIEDGKDLPYKKESLGCQQKNKIVGMDIQHVRSVSTFQSEGHGLVDQLGKFKLLRVLDLEDCKDLKDKHVREVCKLYLLRFLSLKGTNIKVMPPEVGDLEHLQTLNAAHTKIKELPDTVTKLEKLERLDFSNKDDWTIMWKLPQGLRNMKALRHMAWVTLSMEEEDIEVAGEIGELEQLESLSIFPDGRTTDKSERVLKVLTTSLGKVNNLRILDIGRFGGGLNFVGSLTSPPRLLRYLSLDGPMDELPKWLTSLAFLIEIHLPNTGINSDKIFAILCKLPNLQSIWLGGSVSNSNGELIACSSHCFPGLTRLMVSSNYQVFRFEERSMPKLETLSVGFGDHNKKIIGIEHLKKIKEVILSGGRGNSALGIAVQQLKVESNSRPNSFNVVVKYTS